MKQKGKPESKIRTTKTNTNKRKAPEAPSKEKKFDASLIKKNEFAVILLGALLLTVIIFFVFFRSSEPKTDSRKQPMAGTSFAELEKRIEQIENTLQIQYKSCDPGSVNKKRSGVDPLKERVTRLETAFSVKFDSLVEQMEKLERNMMALKKKSASAPAPQKKTVAKKSAPPVKKTMTKSKKASMFHTVQKGETLYSISKKYNTTVSALRKLNNFSEKTKIYPGNNILIR